MASVLYAALAALFLIGLSVNVIKTRKANKVSLGDGGIDELQVARSAHSNATEYLPISLLLLFALELNSMPMFVLHLAGISILAGRILHAKGLLQGVMSARVTGMKLTFISIAVMAVLNLLFLPYGQFFSL